MYVLSFTIHATCTSTCTVSAVVVWLITFWCSDRFREAFPVLIRIISDIAEAFCAGRGRERETERVVKLETWTLFTAVHCQTCIYTYKLLYTTGSLLEFEFTLWNWFSNLLIFIHPTLEFKTFLHIITYKSCTWLTFTNYTLAFALQLRKRHGKNSGRVADGCQMVR